MTGSFSSKKKTPPKGNPFAKGNPPKVPVAGGKPMPTPRPKMPGAKPC